MRVCVCGQERGRVCVCVHAIGRERVREREGVAEFLGGWTHQPTFFRWNGSKMSSILTPALHNPNPLKNQFQSLLNNCEQHRFIFLLDCDPLLTRKDSLLLLHLLSQKKSKIELKWIWSHPPKKNFGIVKVFRQNQISERKKVFRQIEFFSEKTPKQLNSIKNGRTSWCQTNLKKVGVLFFRCYCFKILQHSNGLRCFN